MSKTSQNSLELFNIGARTRLLKRLEWKYSAYFVIMQEVIKIAIEEGKSFVDFGPTANDPKHRFGCRSVSLIGCVSVSPLLALILKRAAKSVE